jgi:hypothetical protein
MGDSTANATIPVDFAIPVPLPLYSKKSISRNSGLADIKI